MDNTIKILYVDDEPINLMLFEKMFKIKFSVITAASGFKGLEILEKFADIKVIISDMKMPEMTGIQFIKKAKVLYPEILFFILTGYEITEEIQQSLEDGLILKYFQKPFNMVEIEESIVKELEKRFT